ncbi:MAG TPA: universal stress protein [Anaerolineae bacterium]
MEQIKTHLHLGYLYEPPMRDEWIAYIRGMSQLLDSPPYRLPQGENGSTPEKIPENGDGAVDLLLYCERGRPWWQRWLGTIPSRQLIERATSSVLVTRDPRWPVRRILLILRADESDEAAIQWLGELARPSRAELFVLPIVPPLPAMYRYGSIPLQAEVLLAPNTYSGAQLRRLLFLSTQWGVSGTLLLHSSEPQQRIRWAITASECDLIILSDEPYHWLQRWFFGELVRPLLRWVDRPTLIARSMPEHART